MSPTRELYVGYYIALRSPAPADREIQSGAALVQAASRYEAEGMLAAIAGRAFPGSDGWQVTVSATRYADLLPPVTDPDKAVLNPGRRV